MSDERLLLGEIVAAHGVKGLVKVRSFTEEPADLVAYGPLHDTSGNLVELLITGPTKGGLLAKIQGIADRNSAENLKGTRLYVDRSVLPALADEEEEYYHADLIGLAAELPDGSAFGDVKAVHDFGAGDILEIRPKAADGRRETIMIPFSREAVTEVDLANRRLVIAAPEESGDDDDSA